MADLIGQHLGQYEITGLLGVGGMATVYRARQTSIQRDVALKVIESKLSHESDFLKRFEREAQMIASLNHAHILKVFDYGRDKDVVYLVMELLRGGSLADVMTRGALRLDKTVRVLEQVAPALDYAHHKGIIHRDLKPQNLLLDEAGNTLLTDFGLAKLINETAAMTQTGLAMGTPAYMSPEQWMSDNVDGRTDIYALGIILFQMLTGSLPFNAESPHRFMYLHLNELPPPLKDYIVDAPPALEIVIQQALAKDPNMRFNTAGEFARAFRATLSRKSAPTPAPKPAHTLLLTHDEFAAPANSKPPGVDGLAPGSTRADEHGNVQVWVPAGTFIMGSQPRPDVRDDEQPEHEVHITAGFWLDQCAVTNAAYREFIEDSGYSTRQYWANAGWQWLTVNGITGPGDYVGFAEAQQPRVGVSWYEADAYAHWRGGRLPTEAQWEYAARGPQSLIYPWGNVYQDNKANVRGNRTKHVGTYVDGTSWVGALDMIGNVWEWIADWYDEEIYRQDNIGTDPTGPNGGKTRVLRGGSWKHDRNLAHASARRHDGPATRDDYIGFRIAYVADTP